MIHLNKNTKANTSLVHLYNKGELKPKEKNRLLKDLYIFRYRRSP
jgi:hypothetical protein